MIRSGLTNVRKARFEEGFPHQRDTAREIVTRPYVQKEDNNIPQPVDKSPPIMVPSPVVYNDIFGKRTTPDERLYILKQIQQGVKKIAASLTDKPGLQPLPKPTPGVGNAMNRQPGQEPPPSGGLPGEATVPSDVAVPPVNNAATEHYSDIDPANIPLPESGSTVYDEEMEAADVVENSVMTHDPLIDDVDMVAVERTFDNTEMPLIFTENNFNSVRPAEAYEYVEPVVEEQESSIVMKEEQINGVGPRLRTDGARLKIIHQEKRIAKFDENRNFDIGREPVSRWKTAQERSDEKLEKLRIKQQQARIKMYDREFDMDPIKKLGYVKREALPASIKETKTEALPAPIKETKKEALPAPIKETKKEIPSKKAGVSKKGSQNNAKDILRRQYTKTIKRFQQMEAKLKAQGKELSNRQFKILYDTERALADLDK